MAQFGRPISDISAGGWVPSSGGDLYAMLDEVSASDSDYIQGDSSDTAAEVLLSTVTDPVSSSGHILRFRAQSSGGGGAPERLDVELYEGTTLIVLAFNNQAINRNACALEHGCKNNDSSPGDGWCSY